MSYIPAGRARIGAILPPATAEDGNGPGLDVILDTAEGELIVRLTGEEIRDRGWMEAYQADQFIEWPMRPTKI